MAKRRKPDLEEELDPDELEELEAEGAFDGHGLLRDGHRTTVKMYMRDGSPNPYLSATQRAIAAGKQTEDTAARTFGLTDGLQLHRPGFRYNTDAAAVERSRQAYADAEAADANAWRGTASAKPTVTRAKEPHLTTDARAEAYRAYDEEMQNAWRGRK